jgi:hypothetical protein
MLLNIMAMKVASSIPHTSIDNDIEQRMLALIDSHGDER